jgi:hypothetical protein
VVLLEAFAGRKGVAKIFKIVSDRWQSEDEPMSIGNVKRIYYANEKILDSRPQDCPPAPQNEALAKYSDVLKRRSK